MTPGFVPINQVAGEGKPYRLWSRTPVTSGKQGNIILVHGAIAPFFGELHDPKTINNNKFGFYDLDSLLYEDFHYNVFTFEYADMPISESEYVNYNRLYIYGDRLIDAIKKVRNINPDGTIKIIAFSMGGLIARYAAKEIAAEELSWTVNKIITLETGHFGFELAKVIEELWHLVGFSSPSPLRYDQDVIEGSAFIIH